MKKLKIVLLLVMMIMFLACSSHKNRYDRCPTFGLKAKKAASLHASI